MSVYSPTSRGAGSPRFPRHGTSQVPVVLDSPKSRGAIFPNSRGAGCPKLPWRHIYQNPRGPGFAKFSWRWICKISMALDFKIPVVLYFLDPRADWGPSGPTHVGKGGIVVGYRFHVVFTWFRGILPKSHILHKWVVIHSVRGP